MQACAVGIGLTWRRLYGGGGKEDPAIDKEIESEKALPEVGEVKEDNEEEDLEKVLGEDRAIEEGIENENELVEALEDIMQEDTQEGLVPLEDRPMETALVPHPDDKRCSTPKKQTRLYEFVGKTSPDETKILEAIEALPTGARPTGEMFADWGRIGGQKKHYSVALETGDRLAQATVRYSSV